MIWDDTITIDSIVQTVREDLPVTPLPILEAIAKRLVLEFCEKTNCLVQSVDGEIAMPADLEPVLTDLPDVEVEDREPSQTVVMQDMPPDYNPTAGRVTDIGEQVWVQDIQGPMTISAVSATPDWATADLEVVFPGIIPAGMGLVCLFGTNATFSGGLGIQITYDSPECELLVFGSGEIHSSNFPWSGSALSFSLNKAADTLTVPSLSLEIELGGMFEPTGDYLGAVTSMDMPGLAPLNNLMRVASTAEKPGGTVVITTEETPIPWMPTLDATTYPSVLLDWDEYIKAGILSELQTQPGKPWSDAEAAVESYRLFKKGIGKARAEWYRVHRPSGVGRLIL